MANIVVVSVGEAGCEVRDMVENKCQSIFIHLDETVLPSGINHYKNQLKKDLSIIEKQDVFFIVGSTEDLFFSQIAPVVADLFKEVFSITVCLKSDSNDIEELKKPHTDSVVLATKESLYHVIKGFGMILDGSGIVGVDWADVLSILRANKSAFTSTGEDSSGIHGRRYLEATKKAFGRLNTPIKKINNVLVFFSGPKDFQLEELNVTCDYLDNLINEGSNILFSLQLESNTRQTKTTLLFN